jgi:hypothetical protein
MKTRKLRVLVSTFLIVLTLVLVSSLGMVSAKKSEAKNVTGDYAPTFVVPEGGNEGDISTEATERFKAVPGTFLDTGATCSPLVAKWAKKAGLKERGGTHYGLVLNKGCATAIAASAGADITSEHGRVLTQLGFDYKGYCGAGSPRFNVYTDVSAGEGYFVGCAFGTHTALDNPGWTRVRFQEEDFLPFGGAEPFRYSNTVVDEIEIVQDESGKVVLDNIAINSFLIQKP